MILKKVKKKKSFSSKQKYPTLLWTSLESAMVIVMRKNQADDSIYACFCWGISIDAKKYSFMMLKHTFCLLTWAQLALNELNSRFEDKCYSKSLKVIFH